MQVASKFQHHSVSLSIIVLFAFTALEFRLWFIALANARKPTRKIERFPLFFSLKPEI